MMNLSKEFIESIHDLIPQVMLFNQGTGGIPKIEWGEDSIYARILVGGIGLERGYTISGLTVSYIVKGNWNRRYHLSESEVFWLS